MEQPKSKGIFITVEGIDGAGKTAAVEYLTVALAAKTHRTIVRTREPGGTPMAEEIRKVLLTPRNEPVEDNAELMLFFAARAQHIRNIIMPNVSLGNLVLSDRFVDTTYAYQGYGRGLLDKVKLLHNEMLNGFEADFTFLIVASPETCANRLSARGMLDRMDAQSSEFKAKARTGFMDRVQETPSRYAVVFNDDTVEEFYQRLDDVIETFVMPLLRAQPEHSTI